MRGLPWLLLALTACGSRVVPAPDASDGAIEVPCRSADQFASSRMPNDPCAVDSDCHDPFLACFARTVFTCRNTNTPVVTACPAAQLDADIPACPEMASVSLKLCDPTYQHPCAKDADCGPAGFSCTGGQCQEAPQAACDTPADCLAGWACAAPCSCSANAPKACTPPFARFGCPACPADAGAAD